MRLFWLVLGGALALTTLSGGSAIAASRCTDCDLVIAESDLPTGWAFDSDSPTRDASGSASSVRISDCVRATGERRERSGLERQSAYFTDADGEIGAGAENVVRFASRKQAHRFVAAWDSYLHDGPRCTMVKARGDDGSTFALTRLKPVELGSIGGEGAAIASVESPQGFPGHYFAVVRVGRTVVVVEAEETEPVDDARFVQLVEDAASAAAN